jgi:hypothetical protein
MKKHLFIVSTILLGLGAWLEKNEIAIERPLFRSLKNAERIHTILEKLTQHRRLGLLAQYDGDMGDTLQRTGSYYAMLSFLGLQTDDLGRDLREGYETDVEKLTVRPGYFRRSCDFGDWSANPENTSRDQMISLQAAIVTLKDFRRGRQILWAFAERGFLNQNIRHNDTYPGEERYTWKFPDIPSPMQMSLMLRGLGTWLVYPAVFALDTALLLDVTLFRRLNSRELWDSDIKNLPILIGANSYLPTPWSRLALSLYVDQRVDIERRIRYYNDPLNNGIPPLAEIYDLSLEELEGPASIDVHSVLANQ